MDKLTREELIELTEKIMNCCGSEKEIDDMIMILEKNVPHPEVSDLIFWGNNKTADEIVDIALNYKPIIL